ncbi:MFS sugar transporter [Pseudogymnoascus verrucosus]|uniref:MFS sugar transporter n=1 Tax=Pseudogymnoascus verrucosus TaxID=342668 RepID=A0A1B8G9Y0_9PEZI|nr:MFS sugar transporter [Pseudogymnoascus verrucosus]OBT92634.1 MFS sugar transporter [Pseudogymnoascus verrucosus]
MYQATNVYAICGFAAIGGGLFGFDISSMSGVIGTMAYKRYYNNPVSTVQGAITASMPFGSFFGALISSFIADRYSRRTAIQFSCTLWIIGSIIQCASNGVPMLVVGRAVSGICIGIASAIVPVYQSEIAPKEIRGRIVTLQQWAITWGILIQYFIQYGASFVGGGPDDPNQPESAFRIPWGLQMIPAVILFFGLFFLPRSPRWLASKDQWDEAIQVLADLHAGGDIDHPKVLAEYQEIEEALRFEREEATSSMRALVAPRMFKRVLLGMSIQTWSQLGGVNVLMYYIIYVMQAADIGSPMLTASIQYVINVLLTLPAIIYIDRWGRRPSLLLGSLFMMIFFFITGAIQAVYGEAVDGHGTNITWVVRGNKAASGAIVACSYLVVATFATTWGPASWCYPAEIFPSKVRAKAVSLATASNWFWNCILSFAVPPLLFHINWRMYMLFGTLNGLALLHIYIAAPETKGKMLEEMDEVFDSGRRAWERQPKGSRMDDLARGIAEGTMLPPARAYKGIRVEKEVKRDSVGGGRSSSTVSLQPYHAHCEAEP